MSDYDLDMLTRRTHIGSIGEGMSWAMLVRPFNRPSEVMSRAGSLHREPDLTLLCRNGFRMQ
jgi:hypothetical protein